MRVKINDTWYDSDDFPIKVELGEAEFKQICQLQGPNESGQYGYALIPLGKMQWNEEQAEEWMKGLRKAVNT